MKLESGKTYTPFDLWWRENAPQVVACDTHRHTAHCAWNAAVAFMTPKPHQPDTDDWIKIRKEGGIEYSGRARDLGLWK